MKNGHMYELSKKRCPRSAVGENFHFYDFFETLFKENPKKIIIFSLQDN